jgi:hypothetical protein
MNDQMDNGAVVDSAVSQPDSAVSSDSNVIDSASNIGYEPKQQTEKFLSQTEVNGLIAAEKRRAYQRGLEESAKKSQSPVATNDVARSDSSSSVNDSKLQQLIDERIATLADNQRKEAEYRHYEAQASKLVADFASKCDEVRQAKDIPDFDEVMGSVDFGQFPALFEAASKLDNSPRILHHMILNNASLMYGLNALATSSPARAAAEIKRISDGLKLNANSKTFKQSPNPIGRIDSDTTDGLGDGTAKTVADYMHIYKG